MKSKVIIVLVIIIAVASAVYFFKDELFSPSELSSWDYVPGSAAVVWEIQDPIREWNKFLETEHWKNISDIPVFSNANKSLATLDSLTGNSGKFDEIIKEGSFLFSIHTITSSAFDFVFYVNLKTPDYQEEFIRISDHFQEMPENTLIERIYRGQVIREIVNKKTDHIFSYILYKNHFIGSYTPFLIEDVIRTVLGQSEGFHIENSEAFNLSSLEFDAGNIYINLHKFSELAGLALKKDELPVRSFLNDLKGSEFLDIDFDDNHFYLNGFLVPENDSSYLRVFSGQKPKAFDFEGMIPENTSFLFYQSFDKPAEWHENLRQYWKIKDTLQLSFFTNFVKSYEFDLDRMLSWFSGQVVQIYLESIDDNPSKLILIESNDMYEGLNQLNKLVDATNSISGDSLYFENYDETIITLLNVEEFPSKILGNWYRGFPQTYFTVIRNYIVLADDIEAIKILINSREDEFTWQQSVSKSDFLTHNLEESNIGLFVNIPKSMTFLESKLSPEWQKSWVEHMMHIRQLDIIGFQFSNMGDRFYTSIVSRQRKAIQRSTKHTTDRLVMNVALDTTIVIKPKVVRNHNDNSLEVLVQDANRTLSLLSNDGRWLWSKTLSGIVKGKIEQIDFYNSKKLQYLMATDSNLYIIDRNGNFIDNYPIDIRDISTDYLASVDYDRSHNYRFMVSENTGKVYLFDKQGNKLEGWKPRDYESRFAIYPFHMRVRSGDIFVAILENGDVVVTNRRGNVMEGFPLKLGAHIAGNVFYKIKGGFNETILNVVTDEGELISFNLSGQVIDREQLYKPSMNTTFTLVKERMGKSFVIARQDMNNLAIIDVHGEIKFEKDFIGRENYQVQYYNFGADRDLFIIRGAEKGRILIYDGFGMLKSSGIKGDFPVSVIHHRSTEKYHIYSAQSGSLFVYSINE